MRTIRELLDYIINSRTDLVRVYGGDDFPVVAPPAAPEAIARAEAKTAMRFPASYRAFLRESNGIRDFTDEIDLISTEDIISGEYDDVIADIRDLGWRIGERLLVDGFVIGCRPGHRNVFVIDRSVEPDEQGERPVVYWSDSRLLTAATFQEFLQRWCDVSDQLLADAHKKASEVPPGIPMAPRSSGD